MVVTKKLKDLTINEINCICVGNPNCNLNCELYEGDERGCKCIINALDGHCSSLYLYVETYGDRSITFDPSNYNGLRLAVNNETETEDDTRNSNGEITW